MRQYSATTTLGRPQRISSRMAFAAAAMVMTATVAASTPAFAASNTMLFEGVLRASGGTPATDGTYGLTFALYATNSAKTALWTEKATIKISGGQFAHALGSVTPIAPAILAGKSQMWVGIRVGVEPELPRQALHAAIWAMSAQTAAGLSCTGCVPVSALKINDNIDLGAYALKAKSVAAQTVLAQTVTASSFVGDGSKLTGVSQASGDCKPGTVVVGIAADGKLKCASTAGSLPSDGLDEVSNKLLTTQFAETFTIPSGDVNKAIPDNTGLELVSTIKVGDVGQAEGAIEVDVSLVNSDLSKVSLVLLPPNDKKTGMLLCDPCGKTYAKVLKTTYPKPSAPKNGDLTAWKGKSPKGTWNLRIKDTAYCIPQLDKVNCDTKAGTDGKLLYWALRFGVQSSKLVGVQGTLVVGSAGSPHTKATALTSAQADQAALVAGFPALWTLVVPSWTAQKSVATPGQIVYRTDLKKTFVMQGAEWRELQTSPMCGDGVRASTETCDSADLNKKTCASVLGAGAGGTLGCKTDCKGFDTSKCTTPPIFQGSTILNFTSALKINNWYGKSTQQWVLCYRRSVHGASSSTFHSRCNNKGPTMTIIKNNLGYIYGGYAPVSWKSKGSYVATTQSFLFSVTSNNKYAYYKSSGNAMYDRSNYGPTWGGNHDLYVNGNMTTGYANPGYSHKCPMCSSSCTACQKSVAGHYSSWQITELEVWYRK
ncbi:MAG: TLD domain-containing protein [Myxococcales bacterium]|nr:TLD domain-containing protein [Myxococcales bacterium]